MRKTKVRRLVWLRVLLGDVGMKKLEDGRIFKGYILHLERSSNPTYLCVWLHFKYDRSKSSLRELSSLISKIHWISLKMYI